MDLSKHKGKIRGFPEDSIAKNLLKKGGGCCSAVDRGPIQAVSAVSVSL